MKKNVRPWRCWLGWLGVQLGILVGCGLYPHAGQACGEGEVCAFVIQARQGHGRVLCLPPAETVHEALEAVRRLLSLDVRADADAVTHVCLRHHNLQGRLWETLCAVEEAFPSMHTIRLASTCVGDEDLRDLCRQGLGTGRCFSNLRTVLTDQQPMFSLSAVTDSVESLNRIFPRLERFELRPWVAYDPEVTYQLTLLKKKLHRFFSRILPEWPDRHFGFSLRRLSQRLAEDCDDDGGVSLEEMPQETRGIDRSLTWSQ